MEVIKIITTNKSKVFLLNQIFDKNKYKIRVEMTDYLYPEIKRTDDQKELVRYAAKHCARKFSKKCLVTELGLYIKTLKEFPGIQTNYVLKRIGQDGIIKLLNQQSDRQAEIRLALGYCVPGKDTKVFTAVVPGRLTREEKGQNDLGFESIFIPDGHQITLGQDLGLRNELLSKIYKDFAQYYLN
ncbi:MAG TPA: non-canonical purine NTP pyrophosphatase [Patescibacteria group bacterium]